MGIFGSFVKALAQGQQLQDEARQADQELLVLRTEQEVEQRLLAAPPLSIKADKEPEAKTVDPMDSWNWTDPAMWGDQHPGTKNQAMSFDTIDTLSQASLVTSILSKRVMQASEYAVPQRSKFEVGYAIELRDPRQQMSEAAQRRASELSRWLFTCGDPRLRENNTFENFIKQVTLDSMKYDQLAAEIVFDWNGKPAGFLPVDARTIRRARPKDRDLKNLQRGAPRYVQVLNNRQVASWESDEFIFGVRNPRTDIRVNGYGYPELEQAADIIDKLLGTMAYNTSNFTNGIHTAGILAITSAMSEPKFKQYERHIRAMMSGARNANRAVVMQLDPTLKDAVNWLNVTNTNKEMEYSQWISFLLKVLCFPAGTPVQTPQGPVAIEEVRPGDLVLTHKGRYRRVSNTQKRNVSEDMVGLTALGQETRSTKEHPYFVCTSSVRSMKRIFSEPFWCEAKDITTSHYLVVPKEAEVAPQPDARWYLTEDRQEQIRSSGNRSGVYRGYVTEADAFFLGLYYAEGCADNSRICISLHKDEQCLAQITKAWAASMGCNTRTFPVRDSKGVCIQIYGGAVSRSFRTMFGSGAKNKRVPPCVWEMSTEAKRQFLSGVVAGDGHVSKIADVQLGTVSRLGMQDMQRLFVQCGVVPSVYWGTKASSLSLKGTCTIGSLRVSGAQARNVSRWLSGEKGETLRKLWQEREGKKGQGTGTKNRVYEIPGGWAVPVTGVRDVPYAGEVYNLEVEEDHTYVAESFAVHNCSVFHMDPAELGFVFGNEGQSGALSQAGPGERIASSKESGLRPYLRFLQNLLNFKVVHLLDEDFELRLVGFDEATEARKLEYYNKAVRSVLTVNEARAEIGRSQLTSPAASNGPIDGVFQSADQYTEQQAQQMLQQQAMKGQLPGEAPEAPGIGSSPTPELTEGSGDVGELTEADLAEMFDSPEEMQKALPMLRSLEV